MKKCLNSITLGSEVPFVESILAASNAGFKGVEIFSLESAKHYAETTSVGDLRSLFGSHSIEPIGFVLGGFVYQDDSQFSSRLTDITKTMTFAGEIGAENALIFVPSKGDLDTSEAVDRATQRIGVSCDVAGEHGLKIGLEPIGKADFLNTPSSILHIIKEIDASNLGLTIDTFHFYTANCKTDELRDIPADRIFLIHINDAPNLPITELDDSKRVLPGEGEMDLLGFLRVLKDKGYEGSLSVEIFNRDLWAESPIKIAKESKKALDVVMQQAGVY